MRAKQGGFSTRRRREGPGAFRPKRNRKIQHDYDKEIYKSCHLIESFFCKLKQFRAIATCCDKTARNILVAVQLAAPAIWLN